jgi:hypothetical protein
MPLTRNMKPLEKFWPALEAIPGLAAVAAKWQALLRGEFFLLEPWLRPTGESAQSFPDLSGSSRSFCTVVEHGPDDFVGVPPDGSEPARLTRKDLIINRLDRWKLHRCVADVLRLAFREDPVDGLADTWRIGAYHPISGYSFPAYLAIPLESANLQRTVEVLASRADKPFILFAPTGRRLSPASGVILKEKKALFLALADTLVCEEAGRWAASSHAIQALEAFRKRVIPEADICDGSVFFPTPPNATWGDLRMKFIDGETVSVKIRDVAGTFLFSQMGMADRRNSRVTRQWELLRQFARGYGSMTWKSRGADRKNQKRRDNLAKDLKTFSRIEGEPIVLTDDRQGWRTVFEIKPDA